MFKKTLTLTILVLLSGLLPSDQLQYADARGGSLTPYSSLRQQQTLLKHEGENLRAILSAAGDQANVVNQLVENVKQTQSVERKLKVFYTRPSQLLAGMDLPKKQDWIFPAAEKHGGITATYRDQDYMRRFRVHHDGTDLRMKQGTELLAAKDGVVVEASANGYRYNWIAIDHEEGYQAHYGHVTKLLVKAGDIVKQGQVIGLSGGTKGTLGVGFSTGPHLHFELRHHGKLIDPSTVFGTIFAEAFDENYTRY